VPVRAEVVARGLEVPWGIAFLPNGDMLVTERPGRLRLFRGGQLLPAPVITVPLPASGEGGLLGIALHPRFRDNRLFYLYITRSLNRVERWRLSADGTSAEFDRVIIDGIPAQLFHDGGRLRFGPDEMLYVGTGDAGTPGSSQNIDSLAGKILRLTPDGDVPPDNPFPGKPVFIYGIRNTEGFDWPDPETLWIVDHGPSSELNRYGHDEVNVAKAGANLGWPTIYSCDTYPGMIAPSLTWTDAVPPGGAAIYTGTAIPAWRGSLIMGTLLSEHLHRVSFEPNSAKVSLHEVYFLRALGRLRDVVMSPDGQLYVSTSSCDGRGSCPADKDKILRIVPASP
jgi:glucose/arabinose dehydrogenase